MRLVTAQEQVRGLGLPCKVRLDSYYKSLSTDRFNTSCDGRMVKALLEVARDPEAVQDEIDYLKDIKFSQAVYQFKQIQEQMERFEAPNCKNLYGRSKPYRDAKAHWIKQVSGWHLKSLDYNRNAIITDCVPRKDAVAGYSWIETGKRYKGDYLDTLHQDYHAHEERARREGSNNKPILIMTRTQGGGQYKDDGTRSNECDYKSRFISAIDIMQVMMEMKFAKPFQDRMGRVHWYAGGKDDKQIAACIYRMRKKVKRYWKSLDYSKYDQSISDWLIYDAFDIVKAAFKGDEFFDDELFNIVKHDFVNKVFLMPGRGPVFSEKGVPSGSMFTQIIDTLVNLLMITTYMNAKGIDEYDMMIMGDDNLVYIAVDVDTKNMEEYLKHNFDITMNARKVKFGEYEDYPEFLSRTWTPEGVYRAPREMIAKLCWPEQFRNYRLNKDLSPWMILDAYLQVFPRGMLELVDVKLLQHRTAREMRNLGQSKYHSGLMRYMIEYQDELVS